MENVAREGEKVTVPMLKIDEKEVRGHLDKLVKESVEETLNKLLEEDASRRL